MRLFNVCSTRVNREETYRRGNIVGGKKFYVFSRNATHRMISKRVGRLTDFFQHNGNFFNVRQRTGFCQYCHICNKKRRSSIGAKREITGMVVCAHRGRTEPELHILEYLKLITLRQQLLNF